AATVARPSHDGRTVVCEHPTGSFAASVDLTVGAGGLVTIHRAGIVRTARKLMDGTVFPRSS
ncbi:MAG: PrpF protein, partial [Actinomycetota bacterium]